MSWVWHVYTMEIRKILAYRVDFWTRVLGVVAAKLLLAYFLWKAVFTYQGVDKLHGYTFPALMLYYLLSPIIDHIVRGASIGAISQEIYHGTLTRYLIYPVNFFVYKYTSHLAFSSLYFLQLLVALGTFLLLFGFPAGIPMSVPQFFLGCLALLGATYLYFSISVIIEMIAFWADNVWTLMMMLIFIAAFLGGGMVPLSFFPNWAREIIELMPFPYVIGFPIESFLGKTSGWEWARGIGLQTIWAVIFSLFRQVVWQRGMLRYTGVGI